jgi:hypothetical protein
MLVDMTRNAHLNIKECYSKRITVSLSPGCLGEGSLAHPGNSCCLQTMKADAAVSTKQSIQVQIK